MKRQEAVPIKELIDLYIKNLGIEENLNISRIYSAWELVIGDGLARYTVSRYFREGKLYCRINSSVVKNKLFIERRKIRDKINNLVPGAPVKDIILL
jgi:hypothetical protein